MEYKRDISRKNLAKGPSFNVDMHGVPGEGVSICQKYSGVSQKERLCLCELL